MIHATHDFSAHHPHPVTHRGPSLRLSRLCLSNARPPCAFVRRSRQRARRHRRRRRRRTKRWARRKKRGESPSCCSGRHAPQRMRHRSVWVRISPWEYACLPCRRRLEKRCHGFHPRALAIGLHPCNWADHESAGQSSEQANRSQLESKPTRSSQAAGQHSRSAIRRSPSLTKPGPAGRNGIKTRRIRAILELLMA